MSLERMGTFSEIEIDSIGEILNISMGAGATTLSEILGKKVNITTPRVEVLHSSKIQIDAFEPAIGVEIHYDRGIIGNNIMIMKVADAKTILNILLPGSYTDADAALDEMAEGAMAEIMNQMMGASATSLSMLLDREISITPPETFMVENSEQIRKKYFVEEGDVVVTKFRLDVENKIDSDFAVMMAVDLARELVSAFGFMGAQPEPAPAPAPAAEPPRAPEPPRPAYAAPPEPTPPPRPAYEVQPVRYQSFDYDRPAPAPDARTDNLGLIMSVPLEVKVEIGQTKKTVRDILEFAPGMVIELDKQVGSQVDIYVNGKPIAKGDVVVVDEHYGVRITDVPNTRDMLNQLS